MKFLKWIEAQGGSTSVGALLGVDAATVNHWVWGNCSPRPLTMKKLVKLGKGAFDYEDIIQATTRKKCGGKQ